MNKLKKFGIALVATVTLGTAAPSISFGPFTVQTATEVSAATAAPKIEAKAAFAIEPTTGKVLLNQNGDEQLGIASMTKMIVEYILFDAIEKGDISWNQQVPVSEYAHEISHNTSLSNVMLRQDETYSVKELYQALAIYSANGATIALAEAMAGSEPEFVDRMKAQLDEWGIKDYALYNATGLNNSDLKGNIYPGSADKDENSMTARGVAEVAQHLINDYPEALKTTSVPKMTFRKGTSDAIDMSNWNWMLEGLLFERDNVDGLKTGTTNFAGACIAGTAEENGMRIITVVMNAKDGQKDKGSRFKETDKLMDWTFANWEKVDLYEKGDTLKDVDALAVTKGKQKSVELTAGTETAVVLPDGTDKKDISVSFEPNSKMVNDDGELIAPAKKGTEVGKAQINIKGDDLGYLEKTTGEEIPAVTKTAVEKANVFVLAGRSVGDFFSDLYHKVVK